MIESILLFLIFRLYLHSTARLFFWPYRVSSSLGCEFSTAGRVPLLDHDFFPSIFSLKYFPSQGVAVDISDYSLEFYPSFLLSKFYLSQLYVSFALHPKSETAPALQSFAFQSLSVGNFWRTIACTAIAFYQGVFHYIFRVSVFAYLGDRVGNYDGNYESVASFSSPKLLVVPFYELSVPTLKLEDRLISDGQL